MLGATSLHLPFLPPFTRLCFALPHRPAAPATPAPPHAVHATVGLKGRFSWEDTEPSCPLCLLPPMLQWATRRASLGETPSSTARSACCVRCSWLQGTVLWGRRPGRLPCAAHRLLPRPLDADGIGAGAAAAGSCAEACGGWVSSGGGSPGGWALLPAVRSCCLWGGRGEERGWGVGYLSSCCPSAPSCGQWGLIFGGRPLWRPPSAIWFFSPSATSVLFRGEHVKGDAK